MRKIALSLLALAALSTASLADSFSQSSRDNAGFFFPSDSDHQGGRGGGDRGGR